MNALKIFSRFAQLLDINVARAESAWLRLNTDGTVTERTASQTLSDIGGAASGATTSSGLTMATDRLLGRTTASTGAIEEITVGSGLSLSGGSLSATGSGGGKVAAYTVTEDTSASSTSATIPIDDTIPQNTEGAEYGTQAYTPVGASNIITVRVTGYVSASTARGMTVALFKDSDADALAATVTTIPSAGGAALFLIEKRLALGSTSAVTFKLRYGGSTGATNYMNRTSGGTHFGGTDFVTWTILEFTP